MQVPTLRAASSAGKQTPVGSTDERGEGAAYRSETYSHRPDTQGLCRNNNKSCAPRMVMADKTIGISDEVHERLTEYRDDHGHSSFDSAIRELLLKDQRGVGR